VTRIILRSTGTIPADTVFQLRVIAVSQSDKEVDWETRNAAFESEIKLDEPLEVPLQRRQKRQGVAVLLLAKPGEESWRRVAQLLVRSNELPPETHVFEISDTLFRSESDGDTEPNRAPVKPTVEPRLTEPESPFPSSFRRRKREPASSQAWLAQNISIAERLTEREQQEERVREKVKPALQTAVDKRLQKRKKAREMAASSLGQRSLDGARRGENFIPIGEAGPERIKRIERERLAELAPLAGDRRGLSAPATNDTSLQSISPSALLAGVPGATSAGHLRRTRNPLSACINSRKTRAFREEAAGAQQEGSAAGEVEAQAEVSNTTPLSVEAHLKAIMGAETVEAVLSSRADADAIRANLARPLAAGPADQTAYFDFDILHVAWRDSWTAALSDMTREEVAELYDRVVSLVDYKKPDDSNAETNELEQLLTDLGEVVAAASAELTTPHDIIGWLGDRVAHLWSAMSFSDQETLSTLYALSEYAEQDKWLEEDKSEWAEKPNEFLTDIQSEYGNRLLDWSITGSKEGKSEVTYTVLEPNQTRVSGTAFSGLVPKDLEPRTVYDVATLQLAQGAAGDLLDATQLALDNGDVAAPLGRAMALINALQNRVNQPYQFDVFVPDSVNYGIISRYRQKWQPLSYQAGDLSGTLPLAPGETRSFTVKQTRNTTDKSSRSKSALTARNEEFNLLSRSEADIHRRVEQSMSAGARLDSNNSASGKAGFLGNGVTGSTSLNFGGTLSSDTGSDSSTVKKDIAESTRKMAQEFRDEHKVEVSTEETRGIETSQVREISNPNGEISVTYLFYELQRRFEVSSRLQEIIPVILVAFRVPNPDRIDEAWVLKYEWIIRRALLDLKFLPVLENLRTSFAGDEVAVEILEAQWKTQLAVVSELRRQMGAHTDLRDYARDAVLAAAQEIKTATPSESGGGNIEDNLGEALEYAALGVTTGVGGVLAKMLFDPRKKDDDGGSTTDLTGEALGSERDSARQALDWADLDRAQSESALREGIAALERATERYLSAVRNRLDRRTMIDQLLLHIKTNIMHYMQAIWRAENPDQRYLRLYDVKVPWGDDALGFSKKANGEPGAQIEPGALEKLFPQGPAGQGSTKKDYLTLDIDKDILGAPLNRRALHEVADLDQILGFRGNYAIFRLKEANLISTYMIQDFLDTELGLVDPDIEGEIPTAEEALDLARCAWEKAGEDEQKQHEIGEWLVEALEAASKVSQEVTVPTGELFIESLPGSHPVLEDFKLQHRAADAHKAAIDAKLMEIEMLRRAKRVLDGDTSDPEIDKIIQIQGGANINIDDS